MNGAQKTAKAFAIGLACLIILLITGAIVAVVVAVTGGIDRINPNNHYGDTVIVDTRDFYEEYDDITSLSIDIGFPKIYVRSGDVFSVEATNLPVNYDITVSPSGELNIDYRDGSGWLDGVISGDVFFSTGSSDITVTLKEGTSLSSAYFDLGSGGADINVLNTDELYVDGGSGSIWLNNITADNSVFDTGSGKLTISSFETGDLYLNSGSGSVTFEDARSRDANLSTSSGRFSYQGEMTGAIDIDSGSGNVSLELMGSRRDYSLDVDAGSGGIWIDGDKYDDYRDRSWDAPNSITIDGGSGRISIEFY